jgi:hypothetical protein
MHLRVSELSETPVVGPDHPGAAGVRFGFEGGTAHKVGGRYFLFTTEVFDEPKTGVSRLVLFDSEDGVSFDKRLVLADTDRDPADPVEGTTPWSPMAVYDPAAGRWSVFFVVYRQKPGSEQPYNMSGVIGRLDSTSPGHEGIGGPYSEPVLVDFSAEGDAWEGGAGIVSYFPYLVGEDWYAFFGANTAPTWIEPDSLPQEDNTQQIKFHVGLARAESLTGRWTRVSELNPVLMDPEFIENPIVTRVRPDLYAVVYDGGNRHEISYAFSSDGVHWEPEQLMVLPEVPAWLDAVRTPLGLIPEDDGTFTLFFTAFDGVNPEGVHPLWHDGFGYVGRCRVVLEEGPSRASA